MASHLLTLGLQKKPATVLATRSVLSTPLRLQMIPARASYEHAVTIYERMTEEWHEPQGAAEMGLRLLDDPRIDASIVLDAGEPVGHIAVCSFGEVGRIEDVFVVPTHRRRGIGRAMLSRALELCEARDVPPMFCSASIRRTSRRKRFTHRQVSKPSRKWRRAGSSKELIGRKTRRNDFRKPLLQN